MRQWQGRQADRQRGPEPGLGCARGRQTAVSKVLQKDLSDLTAAVVDAFGAWTEDILPPHSTLRKQLRGLLIGTDTRLLAAGGAVVIESPCFFDSIRALEGHLRKTGPEVAGLLPARHMAGGSFPPGAKRYAARNADAYGRSGGGKALIDSFAALGEAFDSSIHTVTDDPAPGRHHRRHGFCHHRDRRRFRCGDPGDRRRLHPHAGP